MNEQRTIIVPNHRLMEDILPMLREGRRVKIRAKGSSMLPMIRDGVDSIVLIQASQDSIRRGCIVLALLGDDRYVLHRVVSVDGRDIELRGDGNPYQREYCRRDDIIAEAVCIERGGERRITKGSRVWWIVQHVWPRSGWGRRLLLFVIRRM